MVKSVAIINFDYVCPRGTVTITMERFHCLNEQGEVVVDNSVVTGYCILGSDDRTLLDAAAAAGKKILGSIPTVVEE